MSIRAAALVLLAFAASASAAPVKRHAAQEFEPVRLPANAVGVTQFAISANAWLLVTSGFGGQFPPQALVTANGGAGWRTIDLPAGTTVRGASVAPNGDFVVSTRSGVDGPQLWRLPPAGAAFAPVPLLVDDTLRSADPSAPAWDGGGRAWIALALVLERRTVVARVAADGTLAEQYELRESFLPRLSFWRGSLYVQAIDRSWRLEGGTFVPAPVPLWAQGETVIAGGGRDLSFDGGRHFAHVGPGLLAVHGSANLLVAGGESGVVLLQRLPGVFETTLLALPQGASEVWRTAGGLVAVARAGDGTVAAVERHRGAVPLRPASTGEQPAASLELVRRANVYRRALGMPPLTADARISRAATNHSRYWARNGGGRRAPNPHVETPGRPGFTGVHADERCEAAGAACESEVIATGVRVREAVDGWIGTYYHRLPLLDPTLGSAGGGGVAGAPVVMDFAGGDALVLRAFGYPSGRYRGPLAFVRNEVPDPVAACRAVRQPVRRPSLPVTAVGPLGVQPFEVQVRAGRRPLRGCTRIGAFLGDRPFVRGRAYEATARFRLPGGGVYVYRWSFHT